MDERVWSFFGLDWDNVETFCSDVDGIDIGASLDNLRECALQFIPDGYDPFDATADENAAIIDAINNHCFLNDALFVDA